MGWEGLFFKWRETVPPLLLGSPLLLIFGTQGIFTILKKKRALHYIALISLAIQALLILMFYMVTQRYATEVIMVFIFGYLYWIRYETSELEFSHWKKTAIGALACISIFTTTVATAQWQGYYAHDLEVPFPLKQQLLSVLRPASLQPPLATQTPTPQMARVKGRVFDSRFARIFYPHHTAAIPVPKGSNLFTAAAAVPDDKILCDNLYGVFQFKDSYNRLIFQSEPVSVYTDVRSIKFHLPYETPSMMITFVPTELPWNSPGKSCTGAVALLNASFSIGAFN